MSVEVRRRPSTVDRGRSFVMAQRRPIAWGPLIGAMGLGAVVAGIIAWQLNLQAIEGQIKTTRTGLRKLSLAGGIPPNQEVMDYLTTRQTALEQHYQSLVDRVSVPPLSGAASADPQLYFQEQLHDVQRLLERLTAARSMPVPEQLGFPKALPPSDTVPHLLVQLSLIKDVATLILEERVHALSSCKIEDPETVQEDGGEGPLLTRLPVRVRLSSSLAQLVRILLSINEATPIIDTRVVRIERGSDPDQLDVELILARHLAVAAAPKTSSPEEATPSTKKKQGSLPPHHRGHRTPTEAQSAPR